MIRSLLLCSVALALAACGPQTPAETKPAAEAPPATTAATKPAPLLGCGPSSLVNADTTYDGLVKALGADNVVKEMVAWVDSEEEAVILYPKDPTMRAELLWLDKTSGGPRVMRVGGDDSKWVGPSGLKVGSSLADIEAANGGPFTMVAFDNHNSGEVNWQGGKLDHAYEDCRFGMALNPGPETSQESLEPLGGSSETTFRSDSPEMRAAKPVAYEFWIDF